MEKFKFIDLFCGIGGFHQALSDLGGECVYASDIDEACRKIYKLNFGLEPDGDITKVDEKKIPYHDILCAGFPCQAFSKAGKRLGFADPTKGTLFFEIMRIAKYHKPKYMLLENVRNLTSHDNGNTWKIIHDEIINAGYYTFEKPVIFSPHYIGIPQHRERVFIMCVRNDILGGKLLPEFKIDRPMVHCDIHSILQNDDEIANISKYQLKPDVIEWIDNWNEFIQNIKCDRLPSFPIWADSLCLLPDNMLYNQWNNLPEWKKDAVRKNALLYFDNKDFIDEWLAKARKIPLFFGAKAKMEWQAGNVENPDIWNCLMQIRPSGLRIKANDFFPALVAITQTSIVGERKRYLTPRECARLQSFPDTFILDENDKNAYKQLGNGVNVEVVKLFARYMLGDKEIRGLYSAENAD